MRQAPLMALIALTLTVSVSADENAASEEAFNETYEQYQAAAGSGVSSFNVTPNSTRPLLNTLEP